VVVSSGHAVAPQILEGAYDFLHDKDRVMALDIVHGNVRDCAFAEQVIGFGALNLRDPRVALSSFYQEPYKVGQNAAQLLVDRIEKGPWKRRPKPKTILLKPKFVEGISCQE
tara:strand:+ start:1606 stop:1941 length:336 start_codon:yes stop_codon:yes gene_type:complete